MATTTTKGGGDVLASLNDDVLPGSLLKVVFKSKRSVEEYLHAVDKKSGILMLRPMEKLPTDSSTSFAVRTIATCNLSELVVLSKRKDDGGASSSCYNLPLYSEKEMLELERQTVRENHEAMATIGKNVSPLAQQLFDSLNKTMKCRWNKEVIVVLDEVLVRPPYDESSISSQNDMALTRVKKVVRLLQGEM